MHPPSSTKYQADLWEQYGRLVDIGKNSWSQIWFLVSNFDVVFIAMFTLAFDFIEAITEMLKWTALNYVYIWCLESAVSIKYDF